MPNTDWTNHPQSNNNVGPNNSTNPSTLRGLPKFDAQEAEAWFMDAEQQFFLTNTTNSYIQAKHVLESLGRDEIEFVDNIRCDIDEHNDSSYQLVKSRLLAVFDNTRWDRASLLLNHPPFVNGIPSVYMRDLLRLTPRGHTPHTLFMAIFISKMPTTLRNALSTASNNYVTHEELATLADLIWDDITSSEL